MSLLGETFSLYIINASARVYNYNSISGALRQLKLKKNFKHLIWHLIKKNLLILLLKKIF